MSPHDLNWLLFALSAIGLGISLVASRLARITKALERIADAYEEAHK